MYEQVYEYVIGGGFSVLVHFVHTNLFRLIMGSGLARYPQILRKTQKKTAEHGPCMLPGFTTLRYTPPYFP